MRAAAGGAWAVLWGGSAAGADGRARAGGRARAPGAENPLPVVKGSTPIPRARRSSAGVVHRHAVIGGLPAAFIGILFTGALLVEVIFSLDGLGLLGFESAVNRDYPVMFGALYVFTLISLIVHLLGDLTYMFVDPRIDLAKRQG